MAALHTCKDMVISIDIKNFFDSIKEFRVRKMFEDLGLGAVPARTLSELCTYSSFVPQGALTSPKIANMITAATFGPEIEEYCRNINVTLTIYADDITISYTNTSLSATQIVTDVTNIIQRHGFRVNRAKTKIMPKVRRQWVCGVVVNQKTNLLRKERKRLRAITYNISRNGLESEAGKNQMSSSQFEHHLKGKVNWFKQLNHTLGTNLNDKLTISLNQSHGSSQVVESSPSQS